MCESKRVAIIAAHGTLDMAYPPLILATAAAALDMEAAIFFTFYGLEILKKDKMAHLQVASLGNPAMPEPIHGFPVPNVVGMLPGMTAVATSMMHSWMTKAHVASIPELIELAKESNVRLIACQMSMDVMGIKKEDLVDGVEVGGAATFLAYAAGDAVSLSF